MAENKTVEEQLEQLRQQYKALEARVSALEPDDSSDEEEEKKPSKKKVKKKTKSKKKPSGKKDPKLTDGGSKPKSSVRDRTKSDFYHVLGKKIYISVPEPYSVGDKQGKPGKSMELDYSYGYNGALHGNLLQTDDGKLIYALAGVGVVYDPADNTQQFFSQHNEDVISICKHPSEPLVATGQRDPKDALDGEDKPFVCIWDYKTMEEQKRIRIGERAVCSVGFTYDGKYIFIIGADDSHTGYFYEWEKVDDKQPSAKPIFEHMTSKDTIHGQTHCHDLINDRYVWLTYGAKTIKWWSVDPKGKSGDDQCKVVTPNSYQITKVSQKAYYCATFTPDMDALVGCHDGHIYVFNKNNKLIKYWDTGKSQISSITMIEEGSYRATTLSGNVYTYSSKHKEEEKFNVKKTKITASTVVDKTMYIGSKSCSILSVNLEDTSEHKTLVSGHSKEIWCLSTHPTKPWLCIGSDDTRMRVWNYDTKEIVFSKPSKHGGVRCSAFSYDGEFLGTGTTKGHVVVYTSEGELVYEAKVCKEEIAAIVWSSDGSKLVVGSWDQTIRVLTPSKKEGAKWKVKTGKGHTSSVTHLTMSVDGNVIMSNSKDMEMLYWDSKTGKRVDEVANDIKWANWKNILGWPVQGIYHCAETYDDVNCCVISGSNDIGDDDGQKIVASGNDTGCVTLYAYPCMEKKPKFKEYLAHSAHVTNTRFSSDSSLLFSSGGGDLAVFQWKIVDN